MIAFYFPIKGVGGVQSLIINLTKELISMEESVKIFHYTNDYIFNELISIMDKLEFYDLDHVHNKDLHNYIDDRDCLIITMLENFPFGNKRIRSKLLFWNVFPTAASRLNNYKGIDFKFMNKILMSYLFRNNGIAFMDNGGIDELEQAGYKIPDKVVFLPIPASELNPVNTYLKRIRKNDFPNITYVGRAIDWKIYPFLKVLKDMVKLGSEKSDRFHFTIITDDASTFKSLVEKEEIHLCVEYKENLSLHDLYNYLGKESDLHFAMGTAAIDASKFGIPTVLLDVSYHELPEYYRYRWIFESENYNLGSIFKPGAESIGQNKIETILEIFDDNEIRKCISDKCFSYTNENHNIKDIAIKLVNLSERCTTNVHAFAQRNIYYYPHLIKKLIFPEKN